MQREKIKAWITKFALTQGIECVDAEICHDIDSSMIVYGADFYAHGKEWHLSLESALEHAEIMRSNKIRSFRKKILKLQTLNFRDM